MTTATRPTRADYDAAFTAECARTYPVIDALEARLVYAVNRGHLESAARVLACPVKVNPPCWQHGRVLYSVARHYLQQLLESPSFSYAPKAVQLLDVGTAKGFSALMLQMALGNSGVLGRVDSVDVIDPISREYRNSVIEVDGQKRLAEYLKPWPEAAGIRFYQSTGVHWLLLSHDRVHVAFIDGKHEGRVVSAEARLLSRRQQSGDVVMFDDVHIPDVWAAVKGMADAYDLERIDVLPKRAYAIGVRR